MPTWSTGPDSSRRRSQRVILNVPVNVSGAGEGAQGAFSEDTHTLVINAHGALITLKARISQGQKLQIKSHTSPAPRTCTVVYVGPSAEGRTQFGVEFNEPAPHFWQVAFPPENWTAASVEDPAAPKAAK